MTFSSTLSCPINIVTASNHNTVGAVEDGHKIPSSLRVTTGPQGNRALIKFQKESKPYKMISNNNNNTRTLTTKFQQRSKL